MRNNALSGNQSLDASMRAAVTFLVLLFFTLNLAANNPFQPEFIRSEERRMSRVFKANPFVALPGQTALAPDPNQLRFQDLRGVDCYAQPDRLEVCGAPDTIAFLLFTKSQEDLENIRINVKFDEGIEFSGFAFTPEPDGGGLGSESLDTVSVQNPESPTFFLNEIRQGDGAVVVYVGVRAECGVDFDANPPNITYTFNYTAPGDVPCELVVTPDQDYGGNVIVPRVEFNEGANIPNALIRNSQAEFCQNVTFTQTTPAAQASGAIFTVDEYGQDAGIMFSSISIAGQVIPAAEYTVDPTSGVVTLPLVGADNPDYFGGDGLISFSEDVVVRVCYTVDGCVPNINIPTEYSVVSACDGEVCTGPPDFIEDVIDPAYNSGVDFARANIYRTISEPVVCGPGGEPTPYVFEVDIKGRIDVNDPVDDALTDVRVNIQACSPSPFGAPIFEIVTPGGAVALDDAVSTYLLADQINANNGTVTNPAGTIILDFRQQRTDIGGGLTDVDGDTFFDDIAGGDLVTLRVTFPVSCSAEGAACITAAPGDEICQFNRIRFDGRRRCNQASANETILLPDNPEFTTASTAGFSNEITFRFPEATSPTIYDGYDFGRIGVRTDFSGNDAIPDPKPAGTPLPVSTQTFDLSYTISGSDLVQCPATNPGTGQLSLRFQGDSRLLLDAVIDNITFDGNPVAPGDVTTTYSEEEGLILLIEEGDADSGTHTYSFDVSLDSNYCSPPQLVSLDAFIQSSCTNGCDCASTRACASTTIRVDPQDQCCTCIATENVEISRISRGFTDATRTTRVAPEDISRADNQRFLRGDTMAIEYKLYFNKNGDLTDINNVNRIYSFDVRLSNASAQYTQSDRYPLLFDYQLARLQVAEVRRANDGSVIRLGDIFSGPSQVNSEGLRIGLGDVSASSVFPQDGEIFHPALPNGGYQFGAGNSGADEADGHVLRVEIGSLNNREDAITPFREALGGGFQESDTFVMVWHVPLIDNPGLITPPLSSFRIVGEGSASNYIGPPANNVTASVSPYTCNRPAPTFEYASPKVNADSRIDYDGCEAEIVHRFQLEIAPEVAGWYANEWREINGIERFEMDFPVPYYYDGGATVEAVGVSSFGYEPDSTAVVDTALLAAGLTYYPDRGTVAGQLIFNDSELEDGVRGDAYVNFDNGENDITTVGGDWPLLATGLGMTDSLVFRIPIARLCGSSPTPASSLRMRYQAANKHLPDYDELPYANNGNGGTRPYYWTNVPDPTLARYFPYDRLGGNFLNPHRQALTSTVYQENNTPPEFEAVANIGSGQLMDNPGATETNTYSLTPDPAQTLNGIITLTVDNSVSLESVSEGGTNLPFTLASSTDTNKIYTVEIPTKVAGEALNLDIETDLLFCDEGRVCVDALVPCGADPAPEVAAAFGVECGSFARCYEYLGGTADLQVSFAPSPSQDICNSRPLSVSFTNNGTSVITDFSPVLFIPEGVDADENSFVATVTPGGSSMSLTGFANDPDLDDVFGLGYDFPDGTLEALLGADGLNPGETLTLEFTAETSCEVTSGLPLAVDVNGLLACGDMLDILPVLGPGINVNIPESETPNFEFSVESPIQLSCGDEGTEILLTALQLGKVDAGETKICFRLPTGTRVVPEQIRPVAPEDFIVDPATIERTPIGTMGGEQVCFPAPSGLRNADFFCLNVPVFVDDISCGERAIGVFLTQESTVNCSGVNCDIDVLTSAMPYLPIEVVPPVSLITAELEAECTNTPGVFNVPYTATVSAPTEDFFGVGEVELVFDVDGNGERDSYDVMVGATQAVAFNVPAGEEFSFSGTFENINQSQLCPLLLVVRTEGCSCDEKVLAFPTTVPNFLADLGAGISLCPGDDFTLNNICAPFSFNLLPASAGTITDNGDESITISLNDGVGVSSPVQLLAQGGFGNCTENISVPIRAFEDFSFPDQTITVCNVGCQEVDLNIPATIQDDLMISVTPTAGVVDPNSPEPQFCDIQANTEYTVSYNLANNGCTATSTINVVVFEQPTITLAIEDGCSTGFSLSDNITTNPAGLSGDFDSDGDGIFTPTKDFPGDVNYIPGPEDIKRGFVRIDFQTDDPDGPCGPALVRETFNLKIVDCGTYPWNGGND